VASLVTCNPQQVVDGIQSDVMNDMMISAVASGNELTKMYVTLIDTHCLGEVIPRPQASYIDKIPGAGPCKHLFWPLKVNHQNQHTPI
jgi:hypothetical protein